MTVKPSPPGHDFKIAYRINEACQALGIGRTLLYELVKSGQLKLVKIAGRSVVPRAELEKLIQQDRPE